MSLTSSIDSLLFEEEGTELDFKRDQYPFEGSDERQKSELLKDILAFANAWRRSDAYILIGVQEVKGGGSQVIGVATQLDDAKLQQFVNSKTNHPVDFSYAAVEYSGLQLGVFRIPCQERPVFLSKNYGALLKDTVYIRRGSSTDIAKPDEVAKMGSDAGASTRPQAKLKSELVFGEEWSQSSTQADFKTVNLQMPDIKSLPDYVLDYGHDPLGHYKLLSLGRVNSDFYRERANYLSFVARMRPFRFAVHNFGTAIASGAKIVIHVDATDGMTELVLGHMAPNKPSRENPLILNYIGATRRETHNISVSRTSSRWTITVVIGKIQAKDTVHTADSLFVGRSASGEVVLNLSIFADELTTPVCAVQTLLFTVSDQKYTYEQLTR